MPTWLTFSARNKLLVIIIIIIITIIIIIIIIGAPNEQLKTNLTDFVNVVLQGDLPTEVREIFLAAD